MFLSPCTDSSSSWNFAISLAEAEGAGGARRWRARKKLGRDMTANVSQWDLMAAGKFEMSEANSNPHLPKSDFLSLHSKNNYAFPVTMRPPSSSFNDGGGGG